MSKTLKDVLDKELDELYEMEDGEEKTRKVKNVVELYGVDLKETEYRNAEYDATIKLQQTKIQNYIQVAKIVAETGAIITSLACYNAWYRTGLKFEETGSISSPWVRNLVNKMLPGKKG